MIFKIYLIGLSLTFLWFIFLHILLFEKKAYDLLSESGKKSSDEIYEILKSINEENPQFVFLIIGCFVSLLWFIMMPYIFIKNISK